MYTPNLTVYEELKKGEYQSPSTYLVAMKYRMDNFNPVTVRERLTFVLERDDVDDIVVVEEAEDGYLNIILSANHADDNDDDANQTQDNQPVYFMFTVKLLQNDEPEHWAYEAAEYRNRNLLDDERIAMHQAEQILECYTFLNFAYPQTHLMLQFAVMNAIAGKSYAVQDMVASTFLSGAWLAEMARTYVPPSLELCYIIHAITPEDAENGEYWLHTHGLLKFGLPELEIVRIKRHNLNICQGIITTTAARMLDDPEMWYRNEAELIAHNAQGGIAIRLQSWQDALHSDVFNFGKKGGLRSLFKSAEEPFSGDLSEREEGDIHTEPSMMILADVNGEMTALSQLGDMLNENNHTMLLLPNAETARMYYLANEKLSLFKECFDRFAPQEGQWGYTMKIYCHSDSTDETEHMWFVVQDIDDETVTAELVNDPFNIPEMHKGEIYTIDLDQVTDWQIYSTPMQAQIRPDDAFKLRKFLHENA